jgi:hypothetical protein
MAAPKGRPRPKGAGMQKGTITSARRAKTQRVEWVLSLLEPTFEDDVKEMKPLERARMFMDCLEYVQPKLARTELVGDPEIPVVHKVIYECIDPKDTSPT